MTTITDIAVATISIKSRERDINARGAGRDTYAMIALPGGDQFIWADRVEGATTTHTGYPRQRSIRSRDRHGHDTVEVTVPVGSIVLWIEKGTNGSCNRTAARVEDGGKLADVDVASRRRGDGWVTVVDGVEYR